MIERFGALYIFIFFLFLLFAWFYFSAKQRKLLKKFLLEHGIKCEGQAELIGYLSTGKAMSRIIKVSFPVNGSTVTKTLIYDKYNWFNKDDEKGSRIKITLLVDPNNTDRFLPV